MTSIKYNDTKDDFKEKREGMDQGFPWFRNLKTKFFINEKFHWKKIGG